MKEAPRGYSCVGEMMCLVDGVKGDVLEGRGEVSCG